MGAPCGYWDKGSWVILLTWFFFLQNWVTWFNVKAFLDFCCSRLSFFFPFPFLAPLPHPSYLLLFMVCSSNCSKPIMSVIGRPSLFPLSSLWKSSMSSTGSSLYNNLEKATCDNITLTPSRYHLKVIGSVSTSSSFQVIVGKCLLNVLQQNNMAHSLPAPPRHQWLCLCCLITKLIAHHLFCSCQKGMPSF